MLSTVTQVHDAIDEIKNLGVEGCTFGEHRIRVVGRRIERGLTNESSKIHKGVAYTTDVFNPNNTFRERILFRVEYLAGKPLFLAFSSSRGTIHEQVKIHEQTAFLGGPFNWIFCAQGEQPRRRPAARVRRQLPCGSRGWQDPMKNNALTDIEPLKFLDVVQTYLIDVVREAPERPNFASADFVKELWKDRLDLKEARQMYDKVKYVKDWGDLTQFVVVDISFSSSKLEARLRDAIEELDTAVPSKGRDPTAPKPQTTPLPADVIERTKSLSRSSSFAVPLATGLSRQSSISQPRSFGPGTISPAHGAGLTPKPSVIRSQTFRRASMTDIPDPALVAQAHEAASFANSRRSSAPGQQPRSIIPTVEEGPEYDPVHHFDAPAAPALRVDEVSGPTPYETSHVTPFDQNHQALRAQFDNRPRSVE
eukprot:tig00000950_g5766.t1